MRENLSTQLKGKIALKAAGLSASQTEDLRWNRVLARDRHVDGEFFYAVRSTGIFCRPGCPSRTPARKNVVFFTTAPDAMAAGYRACLRCKPERRDDGRARMIARAAERLAPAGARRTTTAQLASELGTGRLKLMRNFRDVLGITPGEFARAKKVARFRDRLGACGAADAEGAALSKRTRTGATITQAIYEAGFGSSSRLYEGGAEDLGMTPVRMKRGGEGMTIRYTTAASPLGRMLVAATELGVCAILFGAEDAELVADLRRRFGRAELVPSPAGQGGWLADAVAFVANQMTEHPVAATFPLDVRATAFQQRVWKALREIPRGETRSYSDVALAVGRPRAVRAVGAAIGANPLAVAVPCHRVLGKDGSMTGYRWGIERKQKLLAAEQAGTTGKP